MEQPSKRLDNGDTGKVIIMFGDIMQHTQYSDFSGF